jgi:hypothetical protein
MIIASLADALIPLAIGLFVTVVGFSTRFDDPRWQILKKLRFFGPLLVVFGAFLAADSIYRSPDLEQIAAEIERRTGAPVMIDSETRFDGAQAPGDNTLLFNYTLVNLTSNSPELPATQSRLRSMVNSTACANGDWLTLLQDGISISARYQAQDGAEALRVDIRPETCGL